MKASAALAAIRGQQTLNEIAVGYEVHPNLVAQWKKQLQEGAAEVFRTRSGQEAAEEEALRARLYQEIGQLTVELDWLRQKGGAGRPPKSGR
jgi:transposase-like protein